jgi:geranylgeranyl pyrophosphate synthase
MEELTSHVSALIQTHSLENTLDGWLMVELNNAVWRDTVAGLPLDRRMLLLPKCLSNKSVCTATFDELGLLCQRCRHCSINPLQDEAERLGMMSIVAEGFTSIIPLLQSNVVDTIIGVGCLDSLERAFPLLIKQAVPALAVPLNRAGCADTDVDEDYVRELLSMQSSIPVTLLNYDHVKHQLNERFSIDALITSLSPSLSRTSTVALEWLAGDGKRWRPYLLVAAHQALTGQANIPESVHQAAIAVECFHKASLIHDDIQDKDMERNGRQTVHVAEGIPTAINVGDLLLGEGYRLLADVGEPELMRIASHAHLDLCKGQGLELEWSHAPTFLSMETVLSIFELKTVPAFEVALQMAAVCAQQNDPQLVSLFHRYALALGLAYQLLDDIADFDTDEPLLLRPSAVIAALFERNSDPTFVAAMLQATDVKHVVSHTDQTEALQHALDRVGQLACHYRNEVYDVLKEMKHVELKRLLFRVCQRILNN